MPKFWTIKDDETLRAFNDFVIGAMPGGKVTVKFVGEDSTHSQNALIWAIYRDIAEKTGNGVVETRRFCKLHFGVPILRANCPEFATIYDKVLKPQAYEAKMELMDWLDVTSAKEFNKKMASEYIETIIREYSEKGILIEQAQAEKLPYL